MRLGDVVEQGLADPVLDTESSLLRRPRELELSALTRSMNLALEGKEDCSLLQLQNLLAASSASLGSLDSLDPCLEASPHRLVPEMLFGQSGSGSTEASPLSQVLDEALE